MTDGRRGGGKSAGEHGTFVVETTLHEVESGKRAGTELAVLEIHEAGGGE